MLDDAGRIRDLFRATADPGVTREDPVAASAIREHIIAGSPGVAPPERHPKANVRGITRRRAAVVAVACAVGAGTVVVARPWQADVALASLPIREGVTQLPTTSADTQASAVLRRAATATTASTEPSSGIRYQRSMGASLRTVGGAARASVLAPATVRTWVRPDGSGEVRSTPAAAIWPSVADRRAWKATRARLPTAPDTTVFRPGQLDAMTDDYSTDANRLELQLRQRIARTERGPDADAQRFVKLRELVTSPTASRALRAAVYDVASRLRAVRSYGAVRDQLGRPGVAVGVESTYAGKRTRYELIVNPRTGQLLQTRDVLLEAATYVQASPPVQEAFEIFDSQTYAPRLGRDPSRWPAGESRSTPPGRLPHPAMGGAADD